MRIRPLLSLACLLLVGPVVGALLAHTAQTPETGSAPPPLDLQRVQDQDEMTWADYRHDPQRRICSCTSHAPARGNSRCLSARGGHDRVGERSVEAGDSHDDGSALTVGAGGNGIIDSSRALSSAG